MIKRLMTILLLLLLASPAFAVEHLRLATTTSTENSGLLAYIVIKVNPTRQPQIKLDLAKRFMDYLVSEQGRSLITDYKVDGEQLFYVAD